MTFSSQSNTRSTLIRLSGFMLLLLLLNGLIGIAAIRFTNHAYLEDLDQLEAVAQAQDLTQSALIHFKKQVQEWKNILLRGDSSEALEKYRRAFDDEYANVQGTLEALDEAAQELVPLDLRLDEIIAEHAAIKRQYDSALEPFIARQGESPRNTDANVRGIDRALSIEIDNLGASVTAQSAALREAIGRSAAQRYRNIVLFTLIANLALAALMIVILLISLSHNRSP